MLMRSVAHKNAFMVYVFQMAVATARQASHAKSAKQEVFILPFVNIVFFAV